MPKVKQLSVSLENKPGRLAHVCRCLADRKVNIIALSVVETSEQGIVRMVVDRPAKAAEILRKAPMMVTEKEVLLVQLPNKVGALAQATEKLAKKRINIIYVYGSAGKGARKAPIVIATANIAAAQKALTGR
ncbi:MAG: ACT domain-containing protein [Planctomycetota bacterium]|jgi:hypothetical protein